MRFHLPDFSRHYKLNLMIIDLINSKPELFHEKIEIGSVYGAFISSLWNGGRLFIGGNQDINLAKQIINEFNSRGVPIRFTFSNSHIKREHLNDEFCNRCLELANNGMNEVILTSPILETYIRKYYPNFKIVSSTCKRLTNYKELLDELNSDYSMVVLDYDWNNRYDLLKDFPNKDKCEILTNPTCIPNCNERKEHYDYISRNQIDAVLQGKELDDKYKFHDFECKYMPINFYDATNYKTHISIEDITNKYVALGFENFKIEGRSSPSISVLESYVYYFVKPEYKDKLRLELLLNLTKKYRFYN